MIRDIVFASKKSLGLAVRRFRELNSQAKPVTLFAFRSDGVSLKNVQSVTLGTGADTVTGGYFQFGTSPTVVNFAAPISASANDCAMLAFRLSQMDGDVFGGGMNIGAAVSILFADELMMPLAIFMFGKAAEIGYTFTSDITSFVVVYEAATGNISLYVNGALHATAPSVNVPVSISNISSMSLDDGTLTGYRGGYVQFVTFPGAATLPANIQEYVTAYHTNGSALMAP